MDYIRNRLKELSTWNGIILLIGYIVMYFTPDNIDVIIRDGLAALGFVNTFLPNRLP
jgi:hypothetical protein